MGFVCNIRGGNVMLSEKQYYKYLNERFINKHKDLFEKAKEKTSDIIISSPKDDEYKCLVSMLDEIERKYEFNLQRMCRINYCHFILWQKNFCHKINNNQCYIALKFIIVCCLIDKILDSKRFTKREKQIIIDKMNVCSSAGIQYDESNMFKEIDSLLNDIFSFLNSYPNSIYKQIIEDKIKKAFVSEQFMSSSVLKKKEIFDENEMPLLTNKSIEFESAAFLMCSMTENSEHTNEAAEIIAEIMWLVDDICDYVDDIKELRRNSVLYLCSPKDVLMSLDERVDVAFSNIDVAIEKLEESMIKLKTVVTKELYYFIIKEIWDWCSNVRNQVL